MAVDGGWATTGTELVHYDQGRWTKIPAPVVTGDTVAAVALVDDKTGWAVGGDTVDVLGSVSSHDGILRLSNGTWSAFSATGGRELRAVALVDATRGWAVGLKGQLTELSASAWTNQTPTTTLTPNTLNAVALADWSNGWAVGEGGTVLRLQGGTWSVASVSPPTGALLSGLVLTDANNGWAVGQQGTILRLSQGTWSPMTPITDRDLIAITRSSSGTVWAVGLWGTVLRYDGTSWVQCTYDPTQRASSFFSVASGAHETWAVGTEGVRRRLQ